VAAKWAQILARVGYPQGSANGGGLGTIGWEISLVKSIDLALDKNDPEGGSLNFSKFSIVCFVKGREAE
jgi:hypothetical protein